LQTNWKHNIKETTDNRYIKINGSEFQTPPRTERWTPSSIDRNLTASTDDNWRRRQKTNNEQKIDNTQKQTNDTSNSSYRKINL
jgi:hypothetical protein